EITSEDGKIDIACGSGVAPDRSRQVIVYRLLMGLMSSRRFDRLFSEADTTGQFATRPDVARAIIDWADADEQMFSPEGASAGEDYRYDARADRDRASAAGFDSLSTITSLMKNPQSAVLPDDPRYKIFQSMQPIVVNDSELARIAKVESPRVYRIVATGVSGRVKKKITAIVDTR